MVFQLIIGLSAGLSAHRFRVPSLDDYHRHSPSSFSPPSLTRSLTCRLSSSLLEFVKSYCKKRKRKMLGFLNTKFSLESTDSFFLNKIEQKCNRVYTHELVIKVYDIIKTVFHISEE